MKSVRIEGSLFNLSADLVWSGKPAEITVELNRITENALRDRGPERGDPAGMALQVVLDSTPAVVVQNDTPHNPGRVEY